MAALAPVQVAREGDKKCVDSRSSKNQQKLVAPAVCNCDKLRCCRSTKNATHGVAFNVIKTPLTRHFKNVSTKRILGSLMIALCLLSVSVKGEFFMKRWVKNVRDKFIHHDDKTAAKFEGTEAFEGRRARGTKNFFGWASKSYSFWLLLAVGLAFLAAVFFPTFSNADAGWDCKNYQNIFSDTGGSMVLRLAVAIPAIVIFSKGVVEGNKRHNMYTEAVDADDYNVKVKASKHTYDTVVYALCAIALAFCVCLGYSFSPSGEDAAFSAVLKPNGMGALIGLLLSFSVLGYGLYAYRKDMDKLAHKARQEQAAQDAPADVAEEGGNSMIELTPRSSQTDNVIKGESKARRRLRAIFEQL